jgi:hypothetical protein
MIGKIAQFFVKVAQTAEEPKNTEIFSSKLNLKGQNSILDTLKLLI